MTNHPNRSKRELSFDEYTTLVDLAPALLAACKAAQKHMLTPANERRDVREVLHQLGDIIAKTEKITQV